MTCSCMECSDMQPAWEVLCCHGMPVENAKFLLFTEWHGCRSEVATSLVCIFVLS